MIFCSLLFSLRMLDQKKVVLFPEIGQVKTFLSLTRLQSLMRLEIYIFHFKKKKNR